MVSPYCGNKPYVFLSYSHQNTQQALSLIRKMQEKGYRVWYDEGITPGTEWDENIASHVKGCGLFIALMSRQYLSSSNCKDELNFARTMEKPRLIIYLETVELSDGMQMRLSRLQAIHKYKYGSEEAFYQKLFETNGMERCRDEKTAEQMSRTTSAGIPKTETSEQASRTSTDDLETEESCSYYNELLAILNHRRTPETVPKKEDEDESQYYEKLLAILNRHK